MPNSGVTGVLLVNLGTPDNPDTPSLRKYLSEFLYDPRVIELPAICRWLLVNGIIVNTRSAKSAAAYKKIWTEQGSPLLVHTQNLTLKTESVTDKNLKVDFAMRYGQPSIENKLQSFKQQGIERLVILPLYPQYSGSTTASTFDEVHRVLKQLNWQPELNKVDSYFDDEQYVASVCATIEKHWQKNNRSQKLLMSFHGIPQKYVQNGDPYQDQCEQTAAAIADKLSLKDDEWMLVFQSRFGAQKWLQPYCDLTLKELPSKGTKSVDIICPGFSVDCLETLEEIDEENRHYFLEAGGASYSYIPCLNDSDDHAQVMKNLISETINRTSSRA